MKLSLTARLLDECRRQALELLHRNLTPAGIAAATPTERSARRCYTAIFGRDAAICAFGMAASGDPVLERAAVTGLETLATHQARNGQMPKFVEPEGRDADFWYFGCIDSTLWWPIAVYAGGVRFYRPMLIGDLVEIEVHNDKKRMPSYAIEVEDLRAGQPADKRCFFLKVSPGASQVAAYRRIPARRGLDQHTGFRVATRFPFGFFEKSREFRASGDLVIYPAVDPVALPQHAFGVTYSQGGLAVRRGSGDEILGLRLMREGDDPRDVYWKRSTALGTKVVMERASEATSRAHLSIDNSTDTEEPSADWLRLFERKIRETASLAVAHLRRGEPIVVSATAGEKMVASPSEGADSTLRFLALLEFRRLQSQSPSRVHLAREVRTSQPYRPAQQSVTMAPIALSRPAGISNDVRISETPSEAPPPRFSRQTALAQAHQGEEDT